MTKSFNKVFLPGGDAFIGSRACVEMLNVGVDKTKLDNFFNNRSLALSPLEQISGKKPKMDQGDINQEIAAFGTDLCSSGASEAIYCVVIKSAGESVQKPLADFENNMAGALNLLQVL